MLILFEQLQGWFDAVLDAVVLNRRVLEEKIEQCRAELKADIAVLTSAVRHHSERIDKNSEETRLLSERVDKNSEEIRHHSERIDKNSEEIRHHSERIDKNSEETRLLGVQVERMAQRADLALLEHRVTVLERRVGLAPG